MAEETAQVLELVAGRAGEAVRRLPEACLAALEEVRLRANGPLLICSGGREVAIGATGPVPTLAQAVVVSPTEVRETLTRLSRSSLYACEEEMRRGYLTLPGGHRVGLVGRTVLEGGHVAGLKQISGLNLRFARAVPGAADRVLPFLVDSVHGTLFASLVLSPPQAGKTTLLRDVARQASSGNLRLRLKPLRVSVVDERSELAGCLEGVTQLDVGPRTDVLDGCPKAEGLALVVRAMSPQVVVTDELGRPEDVEAVREAARAGVAVVASAHAGSLAEAQTRPYLAPLLVDGTFRRVALLSRRLGPGTLEGVWAVEPGGGMSKCSSS